MLPRTVVVHLPGRRVGAHQDFPRVGIVRHLRPAAEIVRAKGEVGEPARDALGVDGRPDVRCAGQREVLGPEPGGIGAHPTRTSGSAWIILQAERG